MKSRLSVAGTIAVALLLAGCGGGDDESENDVAEAGSEIAASADPADAAIAPPADVPIAPADDAPAEEPPPADEPAPAEPAAGAPPAEASAGEAPAPAGDAAPAANDAAAAAVAPAEGDAPVGEGEAVDADAVLAAFGAEGPALDAETAVLMLDADIDRGRSYAQRCTGCHILRPGPPAATDAQEGPSLFNVVNRRIGMIDYYEYSEAMLALWETEATWTPARLNAYLADPQGTVPGTAMDVAVRDAADRANVIAFLSTLAFEPGENQGAVGEPALVVRIEDADPAEGEALTERCIACHTFGEGEGALVGPNLFALVGAPVGRDSAFAYSLAFEELAGKDAIWTYNRLDEFLEAPAVAVPGTRMGFAGIADENARAALIAYLAELTPALNGEFAVTIGVAQPGLNPLTFSIGQEQLGAVYFALAGCDVCHGGNLRGRYDFLGNAQELRVPALIGDVFEEKWFGLSVYDLLDYVRQHQPGNEDGVFPIVVAHILARNGFVPGLTPLPTDRAELEAMGFYQ